MSKVYAVKNGRQTGIFDSWAECQEQTKGFSGAVFKSFSSRSQAQAYLDQTDEPVATKKEKEPNITQEEINHDDGLYHVYVDGSNKDGKYAWAFVVYLNDEEIHHQYGIGTDNEMASMDNVAGEITAAMEAVKWSVANDTPIVIYHDFLGISEWVNSSWKAKNKFTQAYKAFMQQHQDHYSFVKVKGHIGIYGNERADELAKLALGIIK